MPPLVVICGASGSGKTQLITRLIPIFQKQGLTVGTVKHTHHQGISPDLDHKDTAQYQKAGAQAVILDNQESLILQRPKNSLIKLKDQVQHFLADVDIVLAEGYKQEPIPKIEVWQKSITPEPVCLKDENLIAVVTQEPVPEVLSALPIFTPDDIDSIASFILKKVMSVESEPSVLLLVNGKKIPLKGFVKDFLAGGITGMVRSLKGCDKMRNLEISIQLSKSNGQ